MKQPKIRSMKYEEFKNNDYLESMVKELQDNGVNVVVSKLDDLINWGRSNSVCRSFWEQVAVPSSS